jgi:hypothetical protein
MTGPLDVQSTITSDGLTVDTDTLYVDSANDRVTINSSGSNASGDLIVGNTTGGVFTLTRVSEDIAQNNLLGRIDWFNDDNSGEGQNIAAQIGAYAATSLGEDAYLQFHTKAATAGGGSAGNTLSLLSDGTVNIANGGSESSPILVLQGDTDTGQWRPDANTIAWSTQGNEVLRFDSSQRVLIAQTTARNSFFGNNIGTYNPRFQIEANNTSGGARMMSFVLNDDSNNAFIQVFGRSRGTTANSLTAVAENDNLGILSWQGATGATLTEAAQIKAEVDGTVSASAMPGRLVFRTTGDGNSSSSERMRIDRNGVVMVGVQSTTLPTPGIDIVSNGILSFQDSGGASRNILAFSSGVVQHGAAGGGVTAQTFSTSNVEAMRIDSSQRVLMGAGTGATSTITNGWWNGSTSYSGILNVQNVNDGSAQKYVSLAVSRHSNDVEGGQLGFAKSRGSTANSKTTVGVGDSLGLITFQGADGSNLVEAARITASTDNSASNDDMPGRLQFYTTADGAASPTERFRISRDGNIVFQTPGAKFYFQNTAGAAPYLQNAGTNNSDFLIATGGSERMRITNSGDVELNTPNSGVGLFINNTTHDSVVQIQASAAGKNSVIRFADGDDSDVGRIDYDHANNSLKIFNNADVNGLELSSTKGQRYWSSLENWGTSNYNLSMSPGLVFQRRGTIADDVKIRVFQGGYTYSGGSIEFVIRKGGGSQVSVGSGVIYFNGREAENNHVIVGYNDSSQIVVNSDTSSGTYADGKFTFAIRGTSGDSHISIQNRLGSEVNLALKFNILYTG